MDTDRSILPASCACPMYCKGAEHPRIMTAAEFKMVHSQPEQYIAKLNGACMGSDLERVRRSILQMSIGDASNSGRICNLMWSEDKANALS